MNPHQAYQKLIKGKTKKIAIDNLEGHTSAVMVLPYPPGIPIIMPGEMVDEKSKVIIDFLVMLEEIGNHLPGFEIEIHGLEKGKDGKLHIKIIDA
jgi:lysine decarboxylase